MLFDLHVHSSLSPCSVLPLADILAQARARGLDGVCLTDHDTMEAGRLVREGAQEDGLVVVVGMEYATRQGDFLVFGPLEDLPPGLPAPQLLAVVRERGGAAVGAHPCRPGRSLDQSLAADGSCRIVEGLNGRNREAWNRLARPLAERFGLSLCGGSDAHSLEELGGVRTRFLTQVRSRDDLILALNRGLCLPEARPPARPFEIGLDARPAAAPRP